MATKKKTLKEAIADLQLQESSSAEIFSSNIKSKQSQEDDPKSISQAGEEGIGGATPTERMTKKLGADDDVTKAPYPGANPPVASEPRKKLPGNTFANDEKGETDSTEVTKGSDPSNASHGMKSKLVKEDEGKGKDDDEGRVVRGDDSDNGDGEDHDGDDDGDHDDEVEDKDLVKRMVKPGSLKEHVAALVEGEDLSETFKKKAETIFEAAVSSKLAECLGFLRERYNQELSAAVESLAEEFTEKLDDYLGLVAEEWLKENELAVETSLRTELAEDFMTQLKDLFVEHYIEIPEDKVDIVEELSSKVADLEEQLDESIRQNAGYRKNLVENHKAEIVASLSEGLSDYQAEKLQNLTEGLTVDDEKNFANQVQMLREQYFPTVKAGASELDNAANDAGHPVLDPAGETKKILTEENTTQRSEDPMVDAGADFLTRTLRSRVPSKNAK